MTFDMELDHDEHTECVREICELQKEIERLQKENTIILEGVTLGVADRIKASLRQEVEIERLQAIVDCCVRECWWTTQNRRRRECGELSSNFCERRKVRHRSDCYQECTGKAAEAAGDV